MAHYKVILSYNGGRFNGFQKQLDQVSTRTVQGVVESTLQKLGWQGRAIQAAGRTDAGVHACGQVISFDLDWKHDLEALRSALNAILPYDVRALAVDVANVDFHPRYDAIERHYCYLIYCREIYHPILSSLAWCVWPPVDFGVLQQSAEVLIGSHDYSAFGTAAKRGGSTQRTVLSASWHEMQSVDNLWCWKFDICAMSFLYRMIRRLVYLQVKIGQSILNLELLKNLLDNPPVFPIQGLAPASGLYLMNVIYPVVDDKENKN